MSLKLFSELSIGAIFHFGDKPGRILIKQGAKQYVAPEGLHPIHPHVAVVEKKMKTQPGGRTIFDKFSTQEGDSNE